MNADEAVIGLSTYAADFLTDYPRPAAQRDEDPEAARKELLANTRAISGPPIEVGVRRSHDTTRTPSRDVPVRVYEPQPNPATAAAILYFHGGGFVLGSTETHDAICARLAILSACTVVSVEYRLAPEHPYPAAYDDALRVYDWLKSGKGPVSGDWPIAAMGDSAGGNLALAVAGHARSRDALFAQVLAYPAVDMRPDARESARLFGSGYGLDSSTFDWYARCYSSNEAGRSLPQISPILSELFGYPPTLIMTAECDPLRDQAEEFARRMQEHLVPVTCTRYVGELHGFLRAFLITPAAASGVSQAAGFIRTHLAGI